MTTFLTAPAEPLPFSDVHTDDPGQTTIYDALETDAPPAAADCGVCGGPITALGPNRIWREAHPGQPFEPREWVDTLNNKASESPVWHEHSPHDPAQLVADLFDAIWRGERGGFSEQKIRASLADAEQTLEDLNAKRIRPERVVGRHIKRPTTTARAYLEQTIAEAKRDLAAHGRTNAVNIGNVLYALPNGHPGKQHRVGFTANGSGYAHLFKMVCTCTPQGECGYSATTLHDAHKVEAHLSGTRPI